MQSKSEIRQYFRNLRQDLRLSKQEQEFITKSFFAIVEDNFMHPNISGYEAMHHELDPAFLGELIVQKGWSYCLPVIHEDKQNKILTFRDGQSEKSILPDILIVPLLSFDEKGGRLGYGGGYYDATLAAYQKSNYIFMSIGLAYEQQKFDGDLPQEPHDIKLDYVLTGQSLYRYK